MAKVSIIGSGRVGSTTALFVAQKGLADVVLIDVVEGLPQGTALDIGQTKSLEGFNVSITGTNDFEAMNDSDIVVVTAGLARKPGMTRSDLLEKNAAIVKSVAEGILMYAPFSLVIVVTNPLDVMTYLVFKILNFEKNRVIGMGGVLDSARFASFISEKLKVAVEGVSPMVIGAHSDAMVPLKNHTKVLSKSLTEVLSSQEIEEVITKTRQAGAEIVSYLKTGSAFYAPAAAICHMVKSILKDEKKVLPACVYLNGEYDLKEVCLGVPVKLGRTGVEEIVEVSLSEEEKSALVFSAESVKKDITTLNLTGCKLVKER